MCKGFTAKISFKSLWGERNHGVNKTNSACHDTFQYKNCWNWKTVSVFKCNILIHIVHIRDSSNKHLLQVMTLILRQSIASKKKLNWKTNSNVKRPFLGKKIRKSSIYRVIFSRRLIASVPILILGIWSWEITIIGHFLHLTKCSNDMYISNATVTILVVFWITERKHFNPLQFLKPTPPLSDSLSPPRSRTTAYIIKKNSIKLVKYPFKSTKFKTA